MSTVLVTGGAGFIGSALVRRLVADGAHQVVNVDALTYAGHLESLGPAGESSRHRFVRADVTDAAAMRALFAEHRPAAVYHLAAESHVDRSLDAPADFLHTNVVGTFTLLEAALRHMERLDAGARARFRFVHVSTDEVFGSLGATGQFSENSPYQPRSPYSATKAAADHLVRAWYHTYGLPVVVTNCSNNYGPCQFPEKLIPLVVQKALAGAPVPVYGRGDNVRDWLYVDDHVDALVAVAERAPPGATYLIGGEERTNLDVVRRTCALVAEFTSGEAPRNPAALIRFVEDRPGHDLRYAVDAGKIARDLGWRARETFESGLRKTVAWYVANQDWCAAVQRGSYGGERLGLRGRG